nr:putative holin-like toxin [Paenibacillus agaridevorans]
MEDKDVLTIIFLFGSFILALLHTSTQTTRESKNPP